MKQHQLKSLNANFFPGELKMNLLKNLLKALLAIHLCTSFAFAQTANNYGERMNLPSPLNKVNSAGEYVAACVAATLAFETTAKGTNFDTREARIWGGTVIRTKDQYPDPNFNPWVKKWFDQLKKEQPYFNLIYFERCKKDFPGGGNAGFVR